MRPRRLPRRAGAGPGRARRDRRAPGGGDLSPAPAAPPIPLGDGALRLSVPEGLEPPAVLRALRQLPGVVDAVVTPSCACVYFDPASPPEDPDAALARLAREGPPPAEPRSWIIPVRYDGPDLADVAERTGLTPAQVVELHASREYAVRIVGFLPGFAYLGEVDPRLSLPRLPSPRTRVPASAVGIAGTYTAVYPFASPGGWNLIGTALDFTAFRPDAGATLQLGDRVRFQPAPGATGGRGRPPR